MKRSRSPSPASSSRNKTALFNASKRQKGEGVSENKNIIREEKLFDPIANHYIIREIRLLNKPFSIEFKLEKTITRVGILYVELLNLNERLERQTAPSATKPLKIKLKNDPQDEHLVHLEANSKEEAVRFLEYLLKKKYLSSSTVEATLSGLDETHQSPLQPSTP